MKLRTNLSNHELQAVAKGLQAAAAHADEFVPENPAEVELIHRVETAYGVAVQNLVNELRELFGE